MVVHAAAATLPPSHAGKGAEHALEYVPLPCKLRSSRWRRRHGCARGCRCRGQWRASPPLSVCSAGKLGSARRRVLAAACMPNLRNINLLLLSLAALAPSPSPYPRR